jgi:signal transduction histidine kinase
VQHELSIHRVALRLSQPRPSSGPADRVQLQQVVLNPSSTASKDAAGHGPAAELIIRTCPDERDQVLVMVSDSGVGVAAESADRLFTPSSHQSSGMGIGLSICRSIVEAHGGRLSASDNIGPGATFQFTLPLHQKDDVA